MAPFAPGAMERKGPTPRTEGEGDPRGEKLAVTPCVPNRSRVPATFQAILVLVDLKGG